MALIALVGSVCLGLAAPPAGYTSLAWLGFAPLTWVARRNDLSPRVHFLLGWVGGLGIGLVGFTWIGELLMRFAQFPTLVAYALLFVFAAWTALPVGIWAVGVRMFPWDGWRSWVFGVALWVALANAWPAIFPYTAVIGLAEFPPWMQAAELGGTGAVEAQVVLCGMLLADGLRGRPGRRVSRIGAAVAIPLLSMALGLWRMAALDELAAVARTVRFGVVQPNTPLHWGDRPGKVLRLRTQSRLAQQQGAQVVVWPEAGIYPYRVRRPFERDFGDPYRKVLFAHRVPTVFGAASYDESEYDYNSVFHMGADGVVRGSFDKVHLVPFGEYIPIVDPKWARGHIPAMSHNNSGEGPARFSIEPAPASEGGAPGRPFALGPLICYEDIIADFGRRTAAQPGGIDVFANFTIDTWFGDSAASWEHLALAQFRSVEHRIPMVRSVSTGVSAVVDHAGRLAAHLPLRDPSLTRPVDAELLVHDVKLLRNTAQSPTIYARGGWLFPHVCQLGILALVVAAFARRK